MSRSALQALALVLALGAGASFVAGCWTSSGAGAALRTDVDAHGRRLDDLEKGIAVEREQLRTEVGRAQQNVTRLEEVLEQATAVVTRNSADTGAQVEQLRAQLATAEGQIAEMHNAMEQLSREVGSQRTETNQRIEQLARKAGLDMPVDPATIPADRAEHFATAYRSYQASDYSRARALFREYISRYAQDDNADNAQYWIGSSYLQEGRPATALGELRKVLDQYQRSDASAQALFDMADAFFRLHACTDARAALDTLIRSYSTSPLLRRAQDKKRQIERAPRGSCSS